MLSSLVKNSFSYSLVRPLFSAELSSFTISMLFYASLYFSTSNRTLLALSLVFTLLFCYYFKSLSLSLYTLFILTLPFAKGQGYQILLLAKDQIEIYAHFDLVYYFPLYLSVFFFSLITLLYFRKRIFQKYQITIPKDIKYISLFYLLFCLSTLLSIFSSPFPQVILLSFIQLIFSLLILLFPFILRLKKNYLSHLYFAASASLTFQSLWVIMQRINGGPLGKDLEVYLPGLQRGVFSAENAELLRATGTFYEPSILGTFLFIHIGILSFTLSRKRLSIAARSVLTIALILGLISLVFTGSRALYILTVFFFLYFFSYIKKVNFKAIKERAFPLAITSILVIMLTAPFILSRLNAFSEAFDRYGSATYRYQMILYSFRLGLQKPMGVGISHSPYYFATAFVGEDFIFDAAYPHNLFMHVFSETGIIGFSFFIVFLYFAYRKNLLARKVPNEFGIGSLLFLISAQFYPIFINHIEISYFFFLYLGLYIYSRNLPLNEKEK